MEPLTRLTLQQTLTTLRKLSAGKPDLVISLNLSAAQFFAPGLMQSLYECDETDRALFRHLEMEVKESALTRNFDHASVLVEKLRELGIGVCIDDYGLSRYSLMYLQKLP
ncbi:EAL domain-containing protein, partial [Arthrospira platensis SPKY1]|nr:EAL domain-containing protein [Arthrospira platensis SPKY1]